MAKFDRNQFITFSLDMHHIYKMNGTEYRFAYETNGTVTFSAIEDAHKKVTYEVGTLNRMNGAGQIDMVPYGLMPEHLRPAVVHDIDDVVLSGLSRAQRKRMEVRHAMVQGYLALYEAGAFKVNDAEIAAAMGDICKEATAYLAMTLPDPEYDLKVQAWQAGEGPKPRSKSTVEIPDAVSPRSLRKWRTAFKKGGKKALLDSVDKQGNHNSYFSVDEMKLMAETINREYLNLQRKTVKTVVADVRAAFREENLRRAEEGEAALKTPGREAVRLFIKRMDKFRVLVARLGQEQAMKRMRPTNKGLEVLRPLERVEMDEWKVDLLTILVKSGLLSMFNQEELKEMGLLDRMKRWWMCAAIDCRTKCIVGMSLTANPKTSSSIKCLRMVVSDKGQFADEMGALAPWSMFGTPETLYVDNGSAFKSAMFTSTCIDLGITKIQTLTGAPAMRGNCEGVFHSGAGEFLRRGRGCSRGVFCPEGRGAHPKDGCFNVDERVA